MSPGGANVDQAAMSKSLRMEIRYEVEAILAHRGSGSDVEYQVKWAKWRETTWEPKANLLGATEVLQAYLDTKPRAKPKRKAKASMDGDEGEMPPRKKKKTGDEDGGGSAAAEPAEDEVDEFGAGGF